MRTGLACLTMALWLGATHMADAQRVEDWPPHSTKRPLPPTVDPGPGALPVPPPADAVVLFDGHNLDQWQDSAGGPPKWVVRDGYFEVLPGSKDIFTRRGFGDVQLHVEWAAPSPAHGSDQDRGNSGVYLMSKYEVQVLDSYENLTYADGMAGAIYGQFPPLVNAARPPGVWQSYDIIFHGPRFDAAGKLVRPVVMTVLYNGVLVQDRATLVGPTAWKVRPPYAAHPERLPLLLQDHDHKVRYRNIWLRELPDR